MLQSIIVHIGKDFAVPSMIDSLLTWKRGKGQEVCKVVSVTKEVKAAVWEEFSPVLSSDFFELNFIFTLNANSFGEHFKDFFSPKRSSKNTAMLKGID